MLKQIKMKEGQEKRAQTKAIVPKIKDGVENKELDKKLEEIIEGL